MKEREYRDKQIERVRKKEKERERGVSHHM